MTLVKLLDQKQVKEVANFLTTASAAWFAAGVVAPFFSSPIDNNTFVLSVTFGLSMTLIFLGLSVIIIRDKQRWN